MRELGLEDEIADVPGEDERERECFEIWAENAKTLEVFLVMATQWRAVAVEGYIIRTGLEYTALEATLRLRRGIGRKDWPDIVDGVRLMEAEALKVWREIRERTQQQA